ncbi:survival protein sure-likephosphatase/nucleotidase-like protein [Pseudovirgaria hyperparasitica]|uniref:Survival protein sure-likephosphatase/nucleotidase-like protein n=1 Tax=Pseudovirgaria hyperparasitica TaxID=470096 RepID=A0A6A6W7Z3_9PEZI|nr:survival protein sure-likephosphatase/nucleotidase-like protein [Pseudovirgaria hyperparasitica]KAF2758006.1 survival protein sure-likephosphatase/nucleotidase-like protein [Pseudovirgaria hyperparasitica]
MRSIIIAILPIAAGAIRIVQSNDDGWAEKNIRVFNEVLNAASHSVVLSGPADNQSGSSSSDKPPTPRIKPCEFNSCPANSGPVGADPNNSRLNYVNSYPVTAMKYGIATVSPRELGGAPELAVTGPNVGTNIELQIPFSGTIGAAIEAVKQGIPAIAFSGSTGHRTAFNAATPLYSKIYADLAMNLTDAVIASGAPYLPENVFLNVNFPKVNKKCNDISDFKFVLSRINVGLVWNKDVVTCNNDGRLPREKTVLDKGCFVSVSPGDAKDRTTVDARRQEIVLEKLKSLLTCLP